MYSCLSRPPVWSDAAEELSLRHMTHEPARGERSDVFQCARFLEQMRCSWNNRDLLLTPELTKGLLIELDDVEIGAADDEERRSEHLREFFTTSQIRPSTARDDGGNFAREIGGHPQRRRRAGAGPEQP